MTNKKGRNQYSRNMVDFNFNEIKEKGQITIEFDVSNILSKNIVNGIDDAIKKGKSESVFTPGYVIDCNKEDFPLYFRAFDFLNIFKIKYEYQGLILTYKPFLWNGSCWSEDDKTNAKIFFDISDCGYRLFHNILKGIDLTKYLVK